MNPAPPSMTMMVVMMMMVAMKAIVRYLIDELDADVDAPGEQGHTPLHIAAKFNLPRLVEVTSRRARACGSYS